MENIDNRRQLSAKEIKRVINNKSKSTGIEIKDIIIKENIILSGTISKKNNSEFAFEIGIVGVDYNKVTIKLYNFKVKNLGFLKLSKAIAIKGLLKRMGKYKVKIKKDNIILDMEKFKKDNPRFKGDIEHIYIRENLLNIEGDKLKKMFAS